jgi:hypothetical protein
MDFRIGFAGSRFDPIELLEANEPEDDATAWIVQLNVPLTADEGDRLRAAYGLRLTDYVPELAYIERIGVDVARKLRDDAAVRLVTPYGAGLKVDPGVDVIAQNLGEIDDPEALEFEAVLFGDADAARTAAGIAKLGGEDVVVRDSRHVGGTPVIRFRLADPGAAFAIAQLQDIRWIQAVPDFIDDAGPATAPPGIAPLAEAWAAGLHGEGQVIAMIDNGPPELDHCFFTDPARPAPGPEHRKVVLVRNVANTSHQSHPQFVAGILVGDDVEHPGAHAARGGAWAARLVSGNRVDAKETGLAPELSAAASAGASIHSNSWHTRPVGLKQGSRSIYDVRCADVDNFMWENEDQVVLASSGNADEEQGPPGTAKNTLCVSAARPDGALGDGNAGPTPDGRRKPELSGVGCGIVSALVGTDCGVGPKGDCASSWATPFVAAAATLVRQYFTEGRHPSGAPDPDDVVTPSGALIRAVLLNGTARSPAAATYPDPATGWGLIDLGRSLALGGGARRLSVVDVRHREGVKRGELRSWDIDVDDDDVPLRVTLAWTEPPGTVGALDPVVNDLDLEVRDPSGEVLLGSAFVDGVSAPGGRRDTRNNAEVVLVERPAVGRWTVAVRGSQVNVGAPGQGFAVAVTAALTASD